jgi:hypothetical protein
MGPGHKGHQKSDLPPAEWFIRNGIDRNRATTREADHWEIIMHATPALTATSTFTSHLPMKAGVNP